MSRILYENRCKCKEKFSVTKKRKFTTRNEGKPLQYPKSNEILSQTFQIKYEKELSSIATVLLNSFQKKYIYYAIDDILYLLKADPIERDNLLAILYSPVLSLQNNFSINFFDIWIQEIYIDIEQISKVNKFLNSDSQNLNKFSSITIKLFYKTRVPVQKPEPLW